MRDETGTDDRGSDTYIDYINDGQHIDDTSGKYFKKQVNDPMAELKGQTNSCEAFNTIIALHVNTMKDFQEA